MKDFAEIARDLVPLFHVARTGKPRSVKGCFDKARAYFREHGLAFNPMGCGNKKTGLPGWYRPTGCGENGSCPSDCPYLDDDSGDEKGGCYARIVGSPVERQARRASVDPAATAHSFIACALISLIHFGAPHRALVSGDLCLDDKIDPALLVALILASHAVQSALQTDADTAYLYTHTALPEASRSLLKAAGIAVLRSDRLEPGAAIVYPLDDLASLRQAHPETRLVECPAFRKGATCRSCRLCPRAQDLEICIVLDPHGQKERQVAETARAMH